MKILFILENNLPHRGVVEKVPLYHAAENCIVVPSIQGKIRLARDESNESRFLR